MKTQFAILKLFSLFNSLHYAIHVTIIFSEF